MRFSRVWTPASPETFSIPPVRDLLDRYLGGLPVVVDPFARNSRRGTLTNDHDPNTAADSHLDAHDFLSSLATRGVQADAVLFDPPYSPRQISEHYKQLGLPVTRETTQSSRFRKVISSELNAVLRPGGIAICFGWCSNGMGNRVEYEFLEILLVAHGAGHHDTIVTVQRKRQPVEQIAFAELAAKHLPTQVVQQECL